MTGFVQLEKRRIIARKEGAIWKTKVVALKWFPISEQPKCYEMFIEDGIEYQWVATSNYHFGKNPP